MDRIRELLSSELLGIPAWSYLAAFGLVLAGLLLRRILLVVLTRVRRITSQTRFVFDDLVVKAVERPLGWGAVLAGVWAGQLVLPFPPAFQEVEQVLLSLIRAASVGLLVWMGVRLTDGFCNWWAGLAAQTETKLDDQLVPLVRRTARLALILLGGVLVLQNLGYSVSSLLAGVGLGGMALALASKDTLANLFGSLVIFFDKPFQIGDWVKVRDLEGTVEEVGLRTTRVRTFANSLITVPNALFTTESVENWTRMKKRRIKMTVGLTYSTQADQMDRAVQRIRALIEADDRIHHDFYLVYFDNFGAYSLDIFIYCFTVTTTWAEFLQVKQEFMLQIMRTLEELGLTFAFPTQSLHVESLPGEPEALTAQRPC